jgi:hypothetical protein
MRLPFDLDGSKFSKDDCRIKFIYTSSELNQNIEISIDGDETSVEALFESFHRFLGALGICTPKNVIVGFVDLNDFEDDEDEEDDDDDDEDEEDHK